jgi:hypothetical protein
MLTFGSHGAYEWLVTDDRQLDLLQLCPGIVLGKYVAITSIDSGVLSPDETEKAAGWESRGKIAYSPRVEGIENLPCDGWDEWYVFNEPTDLGTSHLGENIFEVPEERGQVRVFVNYRFALHLPEMNDLATLFWRQVEWIHPESYIADNEFLTFATANRTLFAAARDAVKACCDRCR